MQVNLPPATDPTDILEASNEELSEGLAPPDLSDVVATVVRARKLCFLLLERNGLPEYLREEIHETLAELITLVDVKPIRYH